jgi:hypothetical protein
MSVFGSLAATVAADVVPSAKMTLIAPPSAMTWLAVRTEPSSAAITPEPSEPSSVRTTTTAGPTRR